MGACRVEWEARPGAAPLGLQGRTDTGRIVGHEQITRLQQVRQVADMAVDQGRGGGGGIQQARGLTRARRFLCDQGLGQGEVKIFCAVAHGGPGLRNRGAQRQRNAANLLCWAAYATTENILHKSHIYIDIKNHYHYGCDSKFLFKILNPGDKGSVREADFWKSD